MTELWPTADLDPVRRLRILAAGVPGARVVERELDAPFERVWAVMADLEGGFGEFQTDMSRVTVTGRDGDRVAALARSRFGFRARLHGVLRPGWCWLQSRFLILAWPRPRPRPAGPWSRSPAVCGSRAAPRSFRWVRAGN